MPYYPFPALEYYVAPQHSATTLRTADSTSHVYGTAISIEVSRM